MLGLLVKPKAEQFSPCSVQPAIRYLCYDTSWFYISFTQVPHPIIMSEENAQQHPTNATHKKTQQANAKHIQAMFSRITPRYDLMNRVMTGGADVSWRRTAVQQLRLPKGARVLDLATGTGDLAFAVQERFPDAHVVGGDFSETILRRAVEKNAARPVGLADQCTWNVADALHLPYADHSFDACTNAFLLRNAVDLDLCIREMMRILRPGGQLVCMEISHPQTPVFKQLFQLYFYHMVPVIGGIVAGDRNAYKYLPTSLQKFPPAKPLAEKMRTLGLKNVYYKPLAGGSMAIHVGVV